MPLVYAAKNVELSIYVEYDPATGYYEAHRNHPKTGTEPALFQSRYEHAAVAYVLENEAKKLREIAEAHRRINEAVTP